MDRGRFTDRLDERNQERSCQKGDEAGGRTTALSLADHALAYPRMLRDPCDHGGRGDCRAAHRPA
jgi:hypothetical protein